MTNTDIQIGQYYGAKIADGKWGVFFKLFENQSNLEETFRTKREATRRAVSLNAMHREYVKSMERGEEF